MKEIDVKKISDAVRGLAIEVNINLSEGVVSRLRKALEQEKSKLGRELIQRVIDNAHAAREKMLPVCQDTGTAVVLLEIGQEVHLSGGNLIDAVNDGVRRGWRDGLLRPSILGDPLTRANTGDNTPAVVHVSIVPGDKVRVSFMTKGSGCENMSRLKMLKPSDGEEGVVKFVEETISEAAGRACPPVTLGVGVGGNFEQCALLAKKALFRDPIGAPNPQKHIAELEEKILARVNATGIGPLGMGGTVTALAVHVEAAPVHLSSLPVAVNIDCHAHRHGSLTL